MKRRTIVQLFTLTGCLACGLEPVEPLALDVQLSAVPAQVSAGTEVAFEAVAQGNNLVELVMDFGDGASRTDALQGARTVRSSARHAYATPDVYTATATIRDAGGDTRTAEVEIRVN